MWAVLVAFLLAVCKAGRPPIDAAFPEETLQVTLQPRGTSSVGERLLSPAGGHQANRSSFLALATAKQHLQGSRAEKASSLSSVVDEGNDTMNHHKEQPPKPKSQKRDVGN